MTCASRHTKLKPLPSKKCASLPDGVLVMLVRVSTYWRVRACVCVLAARALHVYSLPRLCAFTFCLCLLLLFQVLPHFGRGAQHQKLQVDAVANLAHLQQRAAAAAHGHPAPKQLDGALEPHALFDAAHFQIPQRVCVLVQLAAQRHGGRLKSGERRLGAAAPRRHAAFCAAAAQKRRGKTGRGRV